MDPLTIPEDLASLDDTALEELADAARAEAQRLANGDVTAEDADRIEALVGDVERIEAQLAERATEREATRERAAAALARIQPAAAADDDDLDDADDDDTSGDDAPPDVDTTDDDTTDGDVEPITEGQETPVAQPEPIAATAARSKATTPPPKRTATAAGVRAARGGTPNVRPTTPSVRLAEFRATPHARDVKPGTRLDARGLAEAICEVRHRFGNRIPEGTREQIPVATAGLQFPDEQMLGGLDPVQNYTIFRRAVLARRAMSEALVASGGDPERAMALVASGGNPAPLPTVYDIMRTAEPQSPVENALPVVGAPRGGIKWIVPLPLGEMAAGIGDTTEAEDAAGYVADGGPTADKPFVTPAAPTEASKEVRAISTGVKFGNLGYRTFPEWVEDRLLDLAVMHARHKEQLYLSAIDAGSVAVTHTAVYGAARGLIYTHMLAATKYRKEQNMGPGAALDLYLPDWVAELIYADAVNDHAQGMNILLDTTVARAQVAAKLRAFGLNVVWYYDEAVSGQAFRAAQNAGALAEFPTNVVSYLHSPGTFVRLDGGTLEVGLYRDSSLNRTNDLEIFNEQWLEVAKVGIKGIKLTTTVKPSGVGPEPVQPLGVA